MDIIDDITGDPKGAEWLSTHPSYDTRIKKLNGFIPEVNKSYKLLLKLENQHLFDYCTEACLIV